MVNERNFGIFYTRTMNDDSKAGPVGKKSAVKKKTAMTSRPPESRPFVHIVYFSLVDRVPDTRKRFLDYCIKYLSSDHHKGMIHFSIGTRALEMLRAVNALDFDVAMNMIFENYEAYVKYRDHEKHQTFITVSVGMSSDRKVYDSYFTDDAINYSS